MYMSQSIIKNIKISYIVYYYYLLLLLLLLLFIWNLSTILLFV